MKRILTGAAAALLAGAMLAPAADAATKLRITLQLPLKSNLGQNLTAFEQCVEPATNNAVDVEIYPSAQLYKDKEVPQAVGSGAIEMGTASLTRYVGTIPAVDIFYVPFMFNSEDMVRKATAPDSPVRGPIDAEILKTGSRVLWWQAYGGAIMLSKAGPLKTPADVKDKKVRVFGKTLGEFIKAVGGVPALISGSEQFLAYQRGTVDAGMTGVAGVKSRKLYEVMDWITVTNHADIEFVVVVNETFWQGLPADQRTAITGCARQVEAELRDAVVKMEADAYQVAKDNGMQVYTPSAAEVDAWRAATKPVLEQYRTSAGSLGAKLVDAAETLRR